MTENNSPWSAKVLLVSFTLLIAFMAPIIVLNFPVLKRSTIRVTPERYLHASVYSLIGAIVSGYILTKRYTEVDYEHTLLIDWYGYNNVCIYFDFYPARYVVCIYVWFIGYFGVNYCLEDIKRLKTLDYLSPRMKMIATNVDRLFMIVCCFLPVWPCVIPEDSMRMHTAPFLGLILGMPIIFITRLFVLRNRASSPTLVTIILFSILSALKSSFTIGALATKQHVSPSLGHTVDVLWTLLALAQPFLVPPIPVLEYQENAWMARALIEDSTCLYNLLYLPLFLCIICSLLGQCVIGAFQHFFAFFQSPSPSPDPSPQRTHGCSAKITPGIDPLPEYEPIPFAKAYLGTIYGFFDSLRGGIRFYELKETLNSPVFATNDGSPVVMCLDYGSAKSMFPHRPLEKGRPAILRIPAMIASHGKAAIDHRHLLLTVLPQTETDPDYLRSFDEIRKEFRHWDDTDIYLDQTVTELCRSLITRFISSTMFGISIPPDLYIFAGASPLDTLAYPSFPQWLAPAYYKRQEAFRLILIQMKASPKWPLIEKTMSELGMTEEEVTFTLIGPIAVNSMGLTMALMQAILLLSSMNEMQHDELLSQTNLLESFCWECIRFVGLRLTFIIDEDTEIKTSTGHCHQVKKGTTLATSVPIVTRDDTIWKDPHMFKPDRFDQNEVASESVPKPEPVPSISFGCPLGTMRDQEQQIKSRQCAFMPLAVPTLKRILRILLVECRWKLDRESRMAVEKSKVQCPIQCQALNQKPGSNTSLPMFDLHPSRLTGGPNLLNELVLEGAGDAKFAKFIFLNSPRSNSQERR
jgi:cytochrome P450